MVLGLLSIILIHSDILVFVDTKQTRHRKDKVGEGGKTETGKCNVWCVCVCVCMGFSAGMFFCLLNRVENMTLFVSHGVVLVSVIFN